MEKPDSDATAGPTPWQEGRLKVLLIDDQPIVGEAVRRMLHDQADMVFHFQKDPQRAIETALEFGPTVILQDLVMPGMDGLELVRRFQEHAQLKRVPLVVLSSREEATTKAEAFSLGVSDYLVKLPDRIELLARIRHHSKGYINLLQRNEAFRALKASRAALAQELTHAADYIRALLPPPVQGEIRADWRFIPSTLLGGDAFGYHWIDERHWAVYLLDVCGHGVASSLLSISIINVLRSQSLPHADFRQPAQVLEALNARFPMKHHNNLFFTLWYGVYRPDTRALVYCNGGHPPPVLFTGPSPDRAQRLELSSDDTILGCFSDSTYHQRVAVLKPFALLYLFSDGVYETQKADGAMVTYSDFLEILSRLSRGPGRLDAMLAHARRQQGDSFPEDDFSLLELLF